MAFVRLDTHVLVHNSRIYPTHKMSFKKEGSIVQWERLMIIWAMAGLNKYRLTRQRG